MMIHKTAIIDSTARISPSAEIAAYCIVGENVTIGSNVKIGPYVFIEKNTTIGDNTFIASHSSIGALPHELGKENINTSLEIGKNCMIYNNVNISRGTEGGIGKTIIDDNVMIMASCHVGHDAVIANNVIIAAGALIGGHVILESYVYLAPVATLHQNIRVGTCAFVSSIAKKDIPPCALLNRNGKISGVNKFMMLKKGVPMEEFRVIKKAYRIYLDKKYLKKQVIDELKKMEPTPELKNFINFIDQESIRSIIR